MPIMALMIKIAAMTRLHDYFKLAQAAFSSLNDRTQESLTSIRMIKAFWSGVIASLRCLRRMPKIPVRKYARGAY